MKNALMGKKYYIYLALTGTFIGTMIIAIIAGAKLVQIGPFMFDGGLLIYASSFVITDIVSEVYGKKYAIRIAQTGFFALLASLLAIQFTMIEPSSPEWQIEQEFGAVMGISGRIFTAAIISYIFSQIADLTIFSWLREKTKGQHFWLRNNVSTICGGSLDAIIFTSIAFYGIYPIIPIVLTAFTVRVAFSLADTPFVYALIWAINTSKNSD